MSIYACCEIATPVGQLRLIADEQFLIGIAWQNENIHRLKHLSLSYVEHHPILIETEQQLNEYFHKQRQVFDLPLNMQGTAFQIQVWQALQTIPYGSTCSYQEIAQRIGRPKAVRAVGTANGQNPYSIIVPCHRVIGKNGQLVGFGGGLEHKITLLQIESHAIQC